MAVADIVAILLGVSLITLALLHYYGDWKKSHWYAIGTGFISWFFPIAVVFVLPLDMSSYAYRNDCLNTNSTLSNTTLICDEPIGFAESDFFLGFWRSLYWTMFCLTWFWIPVMQSWLRCGEFRLGKKLWESAKENIVYYAILGIIGMILMTYIFIAGKFSKQSFWDFLMAAANAWGLLLITISMGYGLVELPRELWLDSNYQKKLRYLEFKAPKLKEEVVDQEAELYEVARDIVYADKKLPANDPLRSYLTLVQAKASCLTRINSKCSIKADERTAGGDTENRPAKIDEKYIVNLHYRVKRAEKMYDKHQSRYSLLLREAFLLQDIIENKNNPEKKFKSTFITPSNPRFYEHKLAFYWYYYVHIKPILLKILSFFCGLATCVILWSESTFQYNTSPPLSVPAFLLRDENTGYVALEEIRYFDYLVVPKRRSDEGSLLFIGSYLCKLTFPLCYNFLNLVTDPRKEGQSNSVFIEYQKQAAKMTPLLGENYDTWLPLIILIFCVITFFNLHGGLLRLLRIKGVLYFPQGNDPECAEGRNLLAQGKKQMTEFIKERSLEERRLHRGAGGSGGKNYDSIGLGSLRGGNTTTSSSSAPTARNAKEFLSRYKMRNDNDTPNHTLLVNGSAPRNSNDSATSDDSTGSRNSGGFSSWFSRNKQAGFQKLKEDHTSPSTQIPIVQEETVGSFDTLSTSRSSRKFGIQESAAPASSTKPSNKNSMFDDL